VRDFLDVRDVAAAYADAVGTDLPPDGAYHIASGRGVTLREILQTLLGMARKPLEAREDPARHRAADIPALVGDATRLRERTGWTPRIALKQTLQDLLDHTRSTL
jgi:GDP-4-dehydro-6-deoxy-D-mannose reductase